MENNYLDIILNKSGKYLNNELGKKSDGFKEEARLRIKSKDRTEIINQFNCLYGKAIKDDLYD